MLKHHINSVSDLFLEHLYSPDNFLYFNGVQNADSVYSTLIVSRFFIRFPKSFRKTEQLFHWKHPFLFVVLFSLPLSWLYYTIGIVFCQ